MKPDRRFTRRQRPEGLAYVQFLPEGGGIVVNASEQGLAFHAAAALGQTGPIQLCVSPSPAEQIKLTADIVWLDETKRFGGLRFTEVTADSGNQIRLWLTQGVESEVPSRPFAVPPGEQVEQAGAGLGQMNGTPDPLSPASDNVTATGSDSGTLAAPRPSNVQATAFPPVPFSGEKRIPILPPQLLYGLATGFLVLVFLFLTGFFSRNFRHEIGNSLIRAGENLKGDRGARTDAPSSMPVQNSNASSPSTSVADAISGGSVRGTSDQPGLSAPTQATEGTVNSTNSLAPNPQNWRRRVAAAPARRSRSPLARQLWAALRAGDSSAEVPLAQLYLTGDGVPKSCDQARVLLRAASKRGDIEALHQLQQLRKSGCR
jgi:PilZ domain